FYKELIAKAILFNEVARIVRSEGFPAYRANIVTYLVASIAQRSGGRLDLKYLWDNQKPSIALETLIRNWSHAISEGIVTSADGRNVTQWAKKLECWKAIQALDLAITDPVPPEFHETIVEKRGWGVRPTEARLELDPDELDALRQCRSLEVADWIRILDWGQ